jgi:hypothetical protein
MVAPNSDLENIIRQVSSWPAGARLTLARRLLEGLEPSPGSGERHGYSAAEAAALVNSRQPAPDDETVRRWVEEHRSEKHER